ncbi:IS630 family transposase [Amycolatopsis sp. CA-230715]|uniref:IS630 family transposase n=1 Tax=Amycolatopsis sp. CA-230715 TaxID=2745196 RepID=UPI001C023428|nr:IS630 family transposase [Amycolatopsis sp. CA-230715]QWF79513.1 IS630 family transposase ISMsm5 [Amycolatopsis sp. CA-230715]QWF82366.1 IS630 family transposase ISMsm5 [Amycolatopsis sp. CA-230715]
MDERAELRALLNSADVPATVATRARIVLWRAESRLKQDVAVLAGVSRPTVDLWLGRYGAEGIAGLLDRPRGAPREQVPAAIRARILAVSRMSPPVETGLSHWSSREMAAFIVRTEGRYVSHHYVAKLWRENGLRPQKQGTFKVSGDPEFAEKVADIVGLYLHPPGAAVVLSIDEKTQIQALDRTQPLLPIDFDASEQRTHDYVRHGTTNLFAALNVGTGEVVGECAPVRDGVRFLAFVKKAVKPHADKEVHVVLDNLSTHTTPEVQAWLADNPNVRFHFTPKGSSWINQIETWFGIMTRQSIRRGTFTSVKVLIKQIRDYITHWNTTATPFTWTATADEILAKVRLVQTNIKKLVDNNAK